MLPGGNKGRVAKSGLGVPPNRRTPLRRAGSCQAATPGSGMPDEGAGGEDGHCSGNAATAGPLLSLPAQSPVPKLEVEVRKEGATRDIRGTHTNADDTNADTLEEAPLRESEGQSPRAFPRLTSSMKGERTSRRKRASDPPWPDAGIVRETPSAEAPLPVPTKFGNAAMEGSQSSAGYESS
jgi:hypothetical protein